MGYEAFCTCGKFMGYASIPYTTKMCRDCLSKLFPGMPIKYDERTDECAVSTPPANEEHE